MRLGLSLSRGASDRRPMRAALGLRTAVIAAGAAVLAVAVLESIGVRAATLALFAAAAIFCELLEGDRARAREPIDEQPLHLASAVHVAAILVLGTWPATLVAGGGAIAPRIFRGGSWSSVAFRAGGFALAALAGGIAFGVGGGHVG